MNPTRGGAGAVEAEPAGARWRILALLSVAELLGMSLWFTASAVAPHLQDVWGLSDPETAWLTGAVQVGFVAGTALAALLNLADVVPSRTYFAVSAVLAAAANAALLAAPGYRAAFLLRVLTGLFLAGVYPPAMKMIATWFRSGRGLAIGTVVGALTLGKATPYLTRAIAGTEPARVVLLASAGAVVAAALVAIAYRDGPYPFPRRPFSWSLVGTVAGHRPTRLAVAGYLGHMWELYAMWTALSIFFFDFFYARGYAVQEALTRSALVGFAGIAAGALGCILAGLWADQIGRERVAARAMAVSAACALTVGWLTTAPTWLVITIALVWGFAVVADSAQFSALVTEVAPPHAVGTALTLQTSSGFLLTAGSIWLMTDLHSRFGWGVAFSVLAIGPSYGILQMRNLQKLRISANSGMSQAKGLAQQMAQRSQSESGREGPTR